MCDKRQNLLLKFQLNNGVDSTNWSEVKAAFLEAFGTSIEPPSVAKGPTGYEKLKQGNNALEMKYVLICCKIFYVHVFNSSKLWKSMRPRKSLTMT
jgi:hypothetical protein